MFAYCITFIFISSMFVLTINPASAQEESGYSHQRLNNYDSGNASMTAIVVDSNGDLHTVWVKNQYHLFYTMTDSTGQTLIGDTHISNTVYIKAQNPSIAIDSMDRIHVVWADVSGQHSIKYTVLDPVYASKDGYPASDGAISVIDDFTVSQRAGNRDWPSIAIDSNDNAHIAWQDSYDELDKLSISTNIYYAMYDPDYSTGSVITMFDQTLLTTEIGIRGHPDIALDSNDLVYITWDDTRGTGVEFVFVVSAGGTMYSELSDLCTLLYGGNFEDGTAFQGVKPMLNDSDHILYETIYSIGEWLPGIASSGSCADHNMNTGPRNTALGITSEDDSGGIRKLSYSIYNNSNFDSGSEDWGPASNWACLSYKDSLGNVPGNPPTAADHKWNLDVNRIILPLSDAGPVDGEPSYQNNDNFSIGEAHDNCIIAGVSVAGLPSNTWSNEHHSHFHDLAHCSDGSQGIHSRTCQGTDIRSRDAGGSVYPWSRSSGSGGSLMMSEALLFNAVNGSSREVFLTVLDPYSQILSNPAWEVGRSGVSISEGNYSEDIGGLIAVDDTKLTNNSANSLYPSIDFDTNDDLHLAWMDGRYHPNDTMAPSEIHYAKFDFDPMIFDGSSLDASLFTLITESPISSKANNSAPNQLSNIHSILPELAIDNSDNTHLVWLDFNSTAPESAAIIHTRLNHTTLTGNASIAFDDWDIHALSTWDSVKLEVVDIKSFPNRQPPAIHSDRGSGVHVVWPDRYDCSQGYEDTSPSICHTHVTTGIVELAPIGDQTYWILAPGETTFFNFSINYTSLGDNSLSADYFNMNVSVPTHWTADLFYSSNDTFLPSENLLFIEDGESIQLYLRVQAPDQEHVSQDVLEQLEITARSTSDLGIKSNLKIDYSLDVRYGVNLSSSSNGASATTLVSPGGTAIINVNVTNTGNVDDYIEFYDSSSLEGQQEWMLPYGWNIEFTNQLWVKAGETVEQELRISIPVDENLATFVFYVKGWSSGEPIKSVERGTYDVLEIFIEVGEYIPPTLNLSSPSPLEKVNEGKLYDWKLNLEGEISSCCQDVTIEVGFNRAVFNDDWFNKDIYNTLGEYDHQNISSPDSFTLELDLFFQSPVTGSAQITIWIRVCDLKECFDDSITIIWFEDDDNDGIENSQDAFPYNPSEWLDSDGDGWGDNEDAFPSDFTESSDYDGDGVGDYADDFPYDANETVDSDADGTGDNSDLFPNDANETEDSDGDGVGDNADAFPIDANETADSDGDGVGDNADAFPNDANETVDSDGDGVGDNSDECQSSDPMDEVESDGCVLQASTSEASSLVIPTIIGISAGAILLTVLAVVLVRRSGDNESVFSDDQMPAYTPHEINPIPEIIPQVSNIPESESGVLGDDGYYWLEWPTSSGAWYYRGSNEQTWKCWE